MTIQINRDAVLYVLSQPPQRDSSAPTAYQCNYHAPHLQPYDDEAEIVVNPAKEEAVIRVVSVSAHNASVPRPQKPDVREAPIETPRRVQFADELVSDIWMRPRTPPGDLRALFYSYEETQRFRQEYRMERNRMAEADPVEDPAAVSATEPLTASADTVSPTLTSTSSTAAWQGPLGGTGNRRHHISRVVIRHHDTLATFFDATYDKTDSNSSDHSPLPGGLDTTGTPSTMTNTQGSEDFFDNDSFWSGSITWY